MKKSILILVLAALAYSSRSQDMYSKQMLAQVTKLDKVNSVKDYQQLSNEFLRIGSVQKTQWLPYYYAAFCDVKAGWLLQDDPDNIEPFANKADDEIRKAQMLLDTTKSSVELSELYCVLSMINRARVFMNPQTYGPKYGPAASQYTKLAENKNPDNPRALYLYGWEKFSTPKMWGGDKIKAKQILQVAKQKLQSNTAPGIEPHWGQKEIDDVLRQIK